MRPRRYLLTAAATIAPLAVAPAQTGYDMSVVPALGRPARLSVPIVASGVLPSNKLTVRVVEQHELPLVQVTAVVAGGSRLDGDRPGMASFVANMLDEGAGDRDATTLQAEVAFLGATLSTYSDWDRLTISLKVPLRSLGPALDLMADVILRPTFSAAEVRRQRDLRLTALLQIRDEPEAVANLAFNTALFPTGHPYHNSDDGDSSSTAMLDSAAVRNFYLRAVRPELTTFVIVGDLGTARARAEIARRFAAWRGVGTGAVAPASAPARTRIASPQPRVYLVDKAAAAQSVIMIGWPGVERRSPDYPALMVLNSLLGGSFTSRLNMNLREKRGYSYGASSSFQFRLLAGPFVASSSVRTDVTDSSLVEIFKEIRAVRDASVPADEVERAKSYVELGLPQSLETTSQIAAQIASLGVFALSLDELPRFAMAVRAVTAADVQRVARQYLTVDQATVVVVGDLAKVRQSIDALHLGQVTVLDITAVAR